MSIKAEQVRNEQPPASIDELWALVQEQRSQLEMLQADLERQRGEKETQATDPADGDSQSRGTRRLPRRTSRRGMLKGVLGAAAATVGAGMLLEKNTGTAQADGTEGPTTFTGPISASTSSISTPAVLATDSSPTGIIPSLGILATSQNGTGIEGDGAVNGVFGNCPSGTGVAGSTVSGSFGVYGTNNQAPSETGSGSGVKGSADSTSAAGVWGENANTGPGVQGVSSQGTGVSGSGSIGVYGLGKGAASTLFAPSSRVKGSANSSSSPGVYGENVADGGAGLGSLASGAGGFGVYAISIHGTGAPGVLGEASGTGTGVIGTSGSGAGVNGSGGTGRGGVFAGGAAQVRLTPASTPHPTSGETGDLFVDSGGHLWYCFGGVNWKKLA